MSYLLINYDDSKPALTKIELPEDSTEWLHQVYKHLECDTIDVVPTILRGIYLVIDDNGKCFDGWERKVNSVASALYGSPWDDIVGNAILTRRDGCELCDLLPSDIEMLCKYFK